MSSRQVKDIRLFSQTIFFENTSGSSFESTWQLSIYTRCKGEDCVLQRQRYHNGPRGSRASSVQCNSAAPLVKGQSPLPHWESWLARGMSCPTRIRKKCHWSSSEPRFHDALCLEILMNCTVDKPGLPCWIRHMPSQPRPAWTTSPQLSSLGFPAGSGTCHPSRDQPEPPALTCLADKLDT